DWSPCSGPSHSQGLICEPPETSSKKRASVLPSKNWSKYASAPSTNNSGEYGEPLAESRIGTTHAAPAKTAATRSNRSLSSACGTFRASRAKYLPYVADLGSEALCA